MDVDDSDDDDDCSWGSPRSIGMSIILEDYQSFTYRYLIDESVRLSFLLSNREPWPGLSPDDTMQRNMQANQPILTILLLGEDMLNQSVSSPKKKSMRQDIMDAVLPFLPDQCTRGG